MICVLPSSFRVADPDGNRTLGLEHESVADDPNVRTLAQDLAKPPEELGAIFRQFLDLARKRAVQARAEIDDLRILCGCRRLGCAECCCKAGEVGTKRRYVLRQALDLCARGTACSPFVGEVLSRLPKLFPLLREFPFELRTRSRDRLGNFPQPGDLGQLLVDAGAGGGDLLLAACTGPVRSFESFGDPLCLRLLFGQGPLQPLGLQAPVGGRFLSFRESCLEELRLGPDRRRGVFGCGKCGAQALHFAALRFGRTLLLRLRRAGPLRVVSCRCRRRTLFGERCLKLGDLASSRGAGLALGGKRLCHIILGRTFRSQLGIELPPDLDKLILEGTASGRKPFDGLLQPSRFQGLRLDGGLVRPQCLLHSNQLRIACSDNRPCLLDRPVPSPGSPAQCARSRHHAWRAWPLSLPGTDRSAPGPTVRAPSPPGLLAGTFVRCPVQWRSASTVLRATTRSASSRSRARCSAAICSRRRSASASCCPEASLPSSI